MNEANKEKLREEWQLEIRKLSFGTPELVDVENTFNYWLNQISSHEQALREKIVAEIKQYKIKVDLDSSQTIAYDEGYNNGIDTILSIINSVEVE